MCGQPRPKNGGHESETGIRGTKEEGREGEEEEEDGLKAMREKRKCIAVVLVLSQVKDLINMEVQSQPPPPQHSSQRCPHLNTNPLITVTGHSHTHGEQTQHTNTHSLQPLETLRKSHTSTCHRGRSVQTRWCGQHHRVDIWLTKCYLGISSLKYLSHYQAAEELDYICLTSATTAQ